MKITTVRDAQNYRHFQDLYPGYRTYFEKRALYEPIGFTPDIRIMLTHGFNNDPERAIDAYLGIEKLIQGSEGKKKIQIEGFQWPSDGAPLKYMSDYRDAVRSGSILAFMLKTRSNEKPLTLIAHSMGNVVALSAASRAPEKINRVIMMGADVRLRDIKSGAYANPDLIPKLINIYSPKDAIVRTLATIMRPGKRLGAYPSDLIPNLNASEYLGKSVHHNDYKSEPRLWQWVRDYLERMQ